MPEPNTRLLVLPAAARAAARRLRRASTVFSVADLNPLKGSDPLRSADYNYFYKRDQAATGFVVAADLVGPDGRCAFDSAPRAAPGEAIAASPDARRRRLPGADQPAQQPGALFHGGPADRAGRRRARRAAARGARRPARHRAADDRMPGGRHHRTTPTGSRSAPMSAASASSPSPTCQRRPARHLPLPQWPARLDGARRRAGAAKAQRPAKPRKANAAR